MGCVFLAMMVSSFTDHKRLWPIQPFRFLPLKSLIVSDVPLRGGSSGALSCCAFNEVQRTHPSAIIPQIETSRIVARIMLHLYIVWRTEGAAKQKLTRFAGRCNSLDGP